MKITTYTRLLPQSTCLGALVLGLGCSDQPSVPSASNQAGAKAVAGESTGGSTVGGQLNGGGGGAVAGASAGGSGNSSGASAGSGGVSGEGAGAQGGGGSAGGGAGGNAAGGNAAGGNAAGGKSAGCGRMEPLNEPPRQYVKHDLTVEVAPEYQPAYTTRQYHTWLPQNYDPNRAYPLYFWGNGCGVSENHPEGIPIANIEEVKAGAILVFMIPEPPTPGQGACFNAGKGGKANTPDIQYFGAMLDEVEASYCVDRGKVFAGGYSSGAWFAATLSCSHGDRLNAVGMAAGGQQDELPMCTGPAGLIVWAGQGDGGNPIDAPGNVAWKGSGAVRDRLIAENGCSSTATKWDPTWPDCNLYDQCGKNPVVFCAHGGGHDAGGGNNINSDGFWKLFKSTW